MVAFIYGVVACRYKERMNYRVDSRIYIHANLPHFSTWMVHLSFIFFMHIYFIHKHIPRRMNKNSSFFLHAYINYELCVMMYSIKTYLTFKHIFLMNSKAFFYKKKIFYNESFVIYILSYAFFFFFESSFIFTILIFHI